MKKFFGVSLCLAVVVCSAVQAAADGPILLVTPQGVFQSNFFTDHSPIMSKGAAGVTGWTGEVS